MANLHEDSPFQSKVKLLCECTACNSKYKIIYFEDEATGEIKNCPFCGEPLDEFAETKDINEEVGDDGSTTYTSDDGSLYEADVDDDDDIDNDDGDDNKN